MCFEVRGRDMLARLGRLETKGGRIETPVLLPVINPPLQLVSPRALSEEFGCEALITNAYILRKQSGGETSDVHKLLDFNGVVMTDSGAYQILAYGKVDVAPADIVHYQEEISADIATILDIPTSWNATKEYAEYTVDETVERAKQLVKIKRRSDLLWVAPIQGGRHLDLVAHSATQVGSLPFQIHALGSPTTIMEQYLFDVLAEMILTAKMNLPVQRPLHLFGAGHPFMFALAIALGCDMFDSAAYAIYARQNRYMTEYGTARLHELEYFPCSCPVCTKHTPIDVRLMTLEEREQALARHNLHASFAELKRVKQMIREGRLWEYLEVRAHAHPSLLQAIKKLKKYEDLIERHSPATKRKGLFYYGHLGLTRPEVVRYRKLLAERYSPPEEAKILIMLPQPPKRPFHKAKGISLLVKKIRNEFPQSNAEFHICVYAAPFGVIPLDLDEVYPLSQHEITLPLDAETIDYVASQVGSYIAASSYEKVVLVEDEEIWKGKISEISKHVTRKDLSITLLRVEEPISQATVLDEILETLRKLQLEII